MTDPKEAFIQGYVRGAEMHAEPDFRPDEEGLRKEASKEWEQFNA